tara:strand:+ start:335 stop:1129 length:795 start_codon:yes stop_codon:yes gene_type:complete
MTTFTNKIINNTNSQPLKQILGLMQDQIANQVRLSAQYEESQTGIAATAFSIECIEANLIHDLARSVVSYTKNDDTLKEFQATTSIKGNFEINGTIIRDEVSYYFATEAIIADGCINRRHLRYITKTTLPNAKNQDEAKAIKTVIKKQNKVQKQQEWVNTLVKYIDDANAEVIKLEAYTRQDWINKIDASDCPMLTNNWEEQDDTYLLDRWGTKEAYQVWLDEANEDKIESQMRRIEQQRNYATRTEASLKKEVLKLGKLLNVA